jgi:hypothetical protein
MKKLINLKLLKMDKIINQIIDEIKLIQKKSNDEHLFESNYEAYQDCIKIIEKYKTLISDEQR